MTKDPAFLFYSSDFLTGCIDLTMEERGQYITLICLQHQKGHLTEKTIRLSVGNISEDVLKKFEKDENGLLFNKRIEEEIEKRRTFAESRRKNGALGGRPKKPLEKPKEKPLGLPSENLSVNVNVNENKKLKTEDIIGFESLFTYWEQNKKGGKYKSESRQRMFNKLKELTNNNFEYAKKAIFYAIDNNYQGFTDGSRLYYKENLPKGEVKTQNIKPNTLPVDIDLWNGEYYDFNLSKAVAKAGDNPDWSKYNRETGTFDL